MTTDLRERLAEQIKVDRRVRAAAARRSVRRDQIKKLKEDIARLQEHHAAKEALRRAWNSNGHGGQHHEGERFIDAPPSTRDVHAGGTRKPEGYLHGIPFYRDEEP